MNSSKVSERSQWLHHQGKVEGTVVLQNDTVTHPRRLEFSFLLSILLKLPLIMIWVLSYGIANGSIPVFIGTMQKHSSKLVQWQCITYKRDSNHVKIFICFLANRQISTYTTQHHRKKKNLTPPMNNYQNEKQILWQWYRWKWITEMLISLFLLLPNKWNPDKKEK